MFQGPTQPIGGPGSGIETQLNAGLLKAEA
jgi:hypothetical protein